MKVEEHYINIEGSKIHYQKIGKGYPVIIIHGWPQVLKPSDDFLKKLENYFNVYLIDLPGFGSSEKLKSEHTIRNFSKSIREVVEKLKIKKPILIGFSLGGFIALDYAINYGNDLKGLVLFTSSASTKYSLNSWLKTTYRFISWLYNTFRFSQVILEKIMKNEFIIKNTWKLVDSVSNFDSPKMNSAIKDIKFVSIQVSKEIFDDVLKIDLSDNCSKISRIPTLIICGENDRLVPVRAGEELHKLMSHSSFFIVPNSNHLSALNEISTKTITNFLISECFKDRSSKTEQNP